MSKTVYCSVLKRDADALEQAPHPGELGIRILENVSAEGWSSWLERLTAIINENGLNTADPETIKLIEQHMVGFLFGEGELGDLPAGFSPNRKK